MPDVFTKAKRAGAGVQRSEVGSRRSEVGGRRSERGSEFLEVEVVAADAEILNDVGDDAARHVSRMPRKRDESVRTERRVKGFASRGGEHRAGWCGGFCGR